MNKLFVISFGFLVLPNVVTAQVTPKQIQDALRNVPPTEVTVTPRVPTSEEIRREVSKTLPQKQTKPTVVTKTTEKIKKAAKKVKEVVQAVDRQARRTVERSYRTATVSESIYYRTDNMGERAEWQRRAFNRHGRNHPDRMR